MTLIILCCYDERIVYFQSFTRSHKVPKTYHSIFEVELVDEEGKCLTSTHREREGEEEERGERQREKRTERVITLGKAKKAGLFLIPNNLLPIILCRKGILMGKDAMPV